MASRLSQMQARFQQKQMQEKEEKLLRLYENQQQRTIERVNRGSAGSNTSISSVTSTQGGKVRQMFDERRQKAGIDRSYPLEPIRTTTNKTVVSKTSVQVKNGKPPVSKREVVHSYYNNNNGDEYFEERRYEDDNLNAPSNYGRVLNKTYRTRDLENLMKNHHIHENLDDEEFPDISIDDVDESIAEPTIRQSHVHNDAVKSNKIIKNDFTNGNHITPTKPTISPKKEVKVAPRKSVVHVRSPIQNSVSPKNSKSSSTRTPPKTPEKKSTERIMASKSPSKDTRTPSVARSTKSTNSTIPSVVSRDNLTPCRYCSRRFASDRINTHEDICSKTARKKRKTYDATKHRLQGTELEPFAKRVIKSQAAKQKPAPVRKSDWRRKHEEFISAIRAAKMASDHVAKGGKLSDLPPPPPSSNPDYVQCPHCGRRFNEAAAARHIPKCASYDFNKPKPQSRPGGPSKTGFR